MRLIPPLRRQRKEESLSMRIAWPTEPVPVQQGYTEKPVHKTKKPRKILGAEEMSLIEHYHSSTRIRVSAPTES